MFVDLNSYNITLNTEKIKLLLYYELIIYKLNNKTTLLIAMVKSGLNYPFLLLTKKRGIIMRFIIVRTHAITLSEYNHFRIYFFLKLSCSSVLKFNM